MGASRSIRFDFLKAIAIISVVFYHIGFQQYGYLGVDIFFVVSGYFLGRSLLKYCEDGHFPLIRFLFHRVFRLWPLLLIAAIASIALGAFVMLPDDFENLAQSAVASNFFMNNILAAITTKNYWDVVNDFKPLMHTWYVGVLVQSYFVFAVICKIASFFKTKRRYYLFGGVAVVSAISLLLYILPGMAEHEKFYYFPTRLFELGIGAIIALLPADILKGICRRLSKTASLVLQIILLSCLALLIALPIDFTSPVVRLLSVNMLTGLLIVLICTNECDWNVPVIIQLSYIGKASFSFFIWHQVIIAFVKYAWCAKVELIHILVCIALTCIFAGVSYILLEVKLNQAMRKPSSMRNWLIVCIVMCLIGTGSGLIINQKGGCVRDVPELGISASNPTRGMHATYCDRVYEYDKDFTDTDKQKVLVFGNSFGRDFGNILLESKYADEIELSYAFSVEEKYLNRIEEADVIFYVIFGNEAQDLPELLVNCDTSAKIYVVGNKNFGENNGNIYNRRNKKDYFESSITLTDDYFVQNECLKQKFGDSFIDLITPMQKKDGTIRVFTDDGKYISQDCRHLTVFGAQYYARVLDLESAFADNT